MRLQRHKEKLSLLQIRRDFGFSVLKSEWREMFSRKHLREDILAGATVGCVAIPLSLAIALASKVDPAVGLVTSIVAGITAAVLGGTPLAVSGPAAAMAVIIAANVEKFGVSGLLIIGLICGILQLALGYLGLGKLIRFIPSPVVAGFTAGIGVIILVGQLPRALGLPPPDQAHVFEVLKHLGTLVHTAKWEVFAVSLATIVLAKGIPRFFPKLPAPLIAVAVPSIFVAFVGLPIPVVGEIPRFLPPPQLPALPQSGWLELIGNAFVVFALASLETLLSSSAVDKISKSKKHDPDQELIGQGVSNIAVTLFGGIPVTGVIARSALNVRSGARTRRSAIVHSLFIMATVFLIAPVISQIPIAALAGMLIAVALSMIQWHEFRTLLRISKGDATVYGITFAIMVLVDLIVGVQAGIVAALLIAVVRMGQLKIHFHQPEVMIPARFLLSGPLTFLSSSKFERVRTQLGTLNTEQPVILDLSRVTLLDASGAETLLELIEELTKKSKRVALKGLAVSWKRVLTSADREGLTTNLHATTESDVERVLLVEAGASPRDRLLSGVNLFEREERENFAEVFEALGRAQKPHTLFITCSDSRIVPNLITSTDPGELFIVRNVGNIIPLCGTDATPAEGAAIEYAVHVLGVKEIILCGHTGCGAMTGLFAELDVQKLPSVTQWLAQVKTTLRLHPQMVQPDDAARMNVMLQLENLVSYPVVRDGLANGELALRGWMYDVRKGVLSEWNKKSGTFVPLSAHIENTQVTVGG